MKNRKPPMRTCVGCSSVKDKREMMRIVRMPEGSVVLDLSGKKNGRGTYVCKSCACFEKALKNKKIERSLEVQLTQEALEKLKEEFYAVCSG